MSDNSNTVGIEKLDKNNYQPWKFRMRNYLIGKSFWGYITGEEAEPGECISRLFEGMEDLE